MVTTQEKRAEPRARVQVRMAVVMDGWERPRTFRTLDLSAKGARCTGSGVLPPDGLVKVRLFLPFAECGRDREAELDLQARVVRGAARLDGTGGIGGYEFALEFVGVDESQRDELRSFLYSWMADDSPFGPHSQEG